MEPIPQLAAICFLKAAQSGLVSAVCNCRGARGGRLSISANPSRSASSPDGVNAGGQTSRAQRRASERRADPRSSSAPPVTTPVRGGKDAHLPCSRGGRRHRPSDTQEKHTSTRARRSPWRKPNRPGAVDWRVFLNFTFPGSRREREASYTHACDAAPRFAYPIRV